MTTHVSPFALHPWHGITQPADFPATISMFVEVVPTDVMKYEVDKPSGHLRLDRPQRFSNYCPLPYGFLPQTYCDAEVAKQSHGLASRGDGDPLDVCVLTERPIVHGNIILTARPIGGLRLIDRGEADDKIIAILAGDGAFGNIETLSQVPTAMVDRLRHYFLTYKLAPGTTENPVTIGAVYEKEDALKVIRASVVDYKNEFSINL